VVEQLRFPFPKAKQGVSFLRGGAKRYAARQGRVYDPTGLDEVQAAPAFQHAVARQYEQASVVPTNRVAAAYKAMVTETHSQYDYLTKPRTAGGLGVQVDFQDEDPYPDHSSMIKDISENRRLKVFKTSSTPDAAHDFFDPETNDKFRAVHDAFGHASIGRSFTRHGEEAAYLSHAQMYSPEAQHALVNETRSLTSALAYGSNPGEFPAGKPAAMPDWTIGRERTVPDAPQRRSLQPRQFRLPLG
jgi:hypothetical protein